MTAVRNLLLLAAAVMAAAAAQAKVKLAAPFTNGMVLQREKPVRVWGTADADERVQVSFAGVHASTVADKAGRWLVELPPMKASKESRVLTANDAKVSDVLVGEVWICSGQSNAALRIWEPNPHGRDGWGAMMLLSTEKPFVRLVKTPVAMATGPKPDVRVVWRKMTSDLMSAYKAGAAMPSAMGYYYALELANALDVPIGIIDSSDGGTNIDSWTPRSGYDGLDGFDLEREWKILSKAEWTPGKKPWLISGASQQPSALWNGMVAAYAPMTVRGFIWYQGCFNVGEYKVYANKMHALYNGWAKEFRNPEMSMYFVQIAPWKGYKSTPFWLFQEAQAKFAAEERNAAMVVINDVGNLDDIHPNDKRTVAKRLSLHALRRNYGRTRVRNESPTLKSWRIEGDRFVLSFNDAEGWYVYNPDCSKTVGFEICGADGVWKQGRIANFSETKNGKGKVIVYGTVEGGDLMVVADGVAEPKKLRYLHSAPWFGALYSDACLPAGAFHIGE